MTESNFDEDIFDGNRAFHLKELLERCSERQLLAIEMLRSTTASYNRSMQMITDIVNCAQNDLEVATKLVESSYNIRQDKALRAKCMEYYEDVNRKILQRSRNIEELRNSQIVTTPRNYRNIENHEKSSPRVLDSSSSCIGIGIPISSSEELIKNISSSSSLVDNVNQIKEIQRQNFSNNRNVLVLPNATANQNDDDNFYNNYHNPDNSITIAQKSRGQPQRNKSINSLKRKFPLQPDNSNDVVVSNTRTMVENSYKNVNQQSENDESKSLKISKSFPVWLEVIDSFTKETGAGKKVIHYNSFCKYCAKFNPDNPWSKTKPRRNFGFIGPRHEASEDHKQAEHFYGKSR